MENTMNMEKAYIISLLRQYNFYSGDNSNINKVSVSEISNGEVLPMVLKRKYKPERKQFVSQATLGSIFDLGMRTLIDFLNREFSTNYKSGEREQLELPNGIILNGETDIIDETNKRIYDVKLSKIFAYKMCEQEFRHHYRMQLNYYNLLLGGGYELILLWGFKDHNAAKPEAGFEEAMKQLPVDTFDTQELISNAVFISGKMKNIINGSEPLPAKCEETWRNDSRCRFYCDCNEVCEYFKEMKLSDNPF